MFHCNHKRNGSTKFNCYRKQDKDLSTNCVSSLFFFFIHVFYINIGLFSIHKWKGSRKFTYFRSKMKVWQEIVFLFFSFYHSPSAFIIVVYLLFSYSFQNILAHHYYRRVHTMVEIHPMPPIIMLPTVIHLTSTDRR